MKTLIAFVVCIAAFVLAGEWAYNRLNFDDTVSFSVQLKGIHKAPEKVESPKVAVNTSEHKESQRKRSGGTASVRVDNLNGIGYQQIDCTDLRGYLPNCY